MTGRGEPIACDEHTACETHREHRRAMRHAFDRTPPPGGEIRQEMSMVELEKLEKAGALIATSNQHCFPLRKRAIVYGWRIIAALIHREPPWAKVG